MIIKDNPVYIFDLDGTLLSQNSFPRWVKYMLCGPLKNVRLRALLLMLQRKIAGVSHADTKRKLQALWAWALEKDSNKQLHMPFLQSLEKLVRPSLLPLLQEVKQGKMDAILATAAAGEYARPFAELLGFRHALTTPLHHEEWVENIGVQKRDAVLTYLQKQGWQTRPRIFFTDHIEDTPMIEQSDVICWFGVNTDLERLHHNLPTKIFHNCLDMDATQLQSLLRQFA